MSGAGVTVAIVVAAFVVGVLIPSRASVVLGRHDAGLPSHSSVRSTLYADSDNLSGEQLEILLLSYQADDSRP